MAELEVDQSHLPRVQEVCQCFAVLEDGALAHNLQEQEIEHYYTANIQKNQLVQNDIRIAKELQQEEQQRTLLRQASRQLEEQDSEYARGIQEEIQRCAEEVRRREQEDEEIAKRIQEEEEERIRARGHERLSDDDTNGPTLSSPHQHTHQGDRQHCSSSATRWQCSTSYSLSHSSGSQAESPMREEALKYTTSRSNEGRTHSTRQIRHELREPLSESSEDSDTVFSEQPPPWSQRPVNRPPTLHCGRPTFHRPCERDLRRVQSSRSRRERQRGWEEHRGGRVFENSGQAENGPRDTEWERSHREQVEGRHSNGGGRCFSLSESFRVHAHRPRDLAPRDLSRTWTCRENPDKRVHFRDDGYRGDGVWEMLGDVLRERGVAVRLGVPGAPLKLDLQSRSDAQPHQRVLQRSATNRSSYRGDAWQRRWSSSKGDGAEARRGERERLQGRAPTVVEEGESDVCQDLSVDSGGGVRRCGAREVDEEEERSSWGHHTGRVGRSRSERCYRYEEAAERLRPEEVDTPHRSKAPGRSHSFSSHKLPASAVLRHASSAGLAVHEETYLDLRELQQVLQDEELARQLQDEEHSRMLRRSHPASSALRTPYPEGDFRVAQVAQDEEIARFIQKQEIKIKRRSRELEGPGPFHEHTEMMSHGDRRAVRDREVQRERLDSEGLPSPTEDFSLENQQASPVSTLRGQQIRNVAEELDPTFEARTRDRDSLRAGQIGPSSQSNPITHPGLHNFLEEPAFIPPTKRQNDKSARFTTKAKERKEKCKQQ